MCLSGVCLEADNATALVGPCIPVDNTTYTPDCLYSCVCANSSLAVCTVGLCGLNKGKSNIATIIGAVLGAIVLLIIIGVIITIWLKMRAAKSVGSTEGFAMQTSRLAQNPLYNGAGENTNALYKMSD